MSDDFKLPDLPSDEELGIDDDDLSEFLEDEGSELSPEEMKALLGEDPAPKKPPPTPKAKAKSSRKDRAEEKKRAKEAARAAKAAAKAEKEAAKQAAKAAKAAKAAGVAGPTPTKGAAEEPPPGQKPPTEGPPPQKKAKPAPEAEGPRTRWRGPVTVALLALAAWMGSAGRAVPRPVPANAPDTAFSSARAMSHVVEIARAAHPPGSPEHDRVRAYVMDELRDLGLEPTVQTTTSMIRRGEALRAVTVRNVLARIPGTDNTGAVLVTAHYDGPEISRAAADDGAGVVSILESLRALQAGEPLRNDLIVLITDAEELGLMGAQAFVDEHPWMNDVQVLINLEMRGAGGPSILFETGGEFGWILDTYKKGAPRPFGTSLAYEIYQRMPNGTDFTRYTDAGKVGLNFAAIGRAHVYHQVLDGPENLSEGTLQHHGLNTLSMLRTLGSEDLSNVRAPDVVYFSVPGLGLVVYPQGWVWPITGVAVLTWIVALLLARVRGSSPVGVGVGLLVPLLTMGGAFAAGTWGLPWIAGFHPERDGLIGSLFHSEGWYVLALLALVLTVLTALWNLARGRFALRDLAVGASLLVVPIVVGVTYLAPLGAMHLQWPALAFLVSLVAATLLPATGKIGELRWLVAVVGAVVVALMLTSLTELVWLAMTIRLAPQLGILMALTLVLMLPALDALREPNAWFAPVLGTVLTAAFLGVGIMKAAPSADRPLPSTLIYALDTETGEALWATQPSRGQGEVDAARAWAVRQTETDFPEARSLESFGGSSASLAVSPAPVIVPPQAVVALLGEGGWNGERAVRVSVSSPLGAERLFFQFPEGIELLAVNGAQVPEAGTDEPQTVTQMEHWGRPDSVLTLDLRLAVTDTLLSFTLVEHSLRPGELLGAEMFRRPADQIPNARRMSDRAMIRTPVRFEMEPMVGAGIDTAPPPTAGPVGDTTQAQPDTTVTPDTAVAPDTTQAPDTTSAPEPVGASTLRPRSP